MFYNTSTKEYPRYQGDLELLGWKEGEPLPENWVEVEVVEMPEHLPMEVAYEDEPIQIDGIWKQNWKVRDLTQDEILENAREIVRQKVRLRETLTKEEASLLVTPLE